MPIKMNLTSSSMTRKFSPALEIFAEESEEEDFLIKKETALANGVWRINAPESSPAISIDDNSASSETGNSIIDNSIVDTFCFRQSHGRCIDCGQQTHVQQNGEGDYDVPLTIKGVVKNGQCLLKDRHNNPETCMTHITSQVSNISQESSSSSVSGSGGIWVASLSSSLIKVLPASLKASNKQLIKTFSGHEHKVYSVEPLGDGNSFITGSWDKTAILWDASTGKERDVYRGHVNGIFSVSPFNLQQGHDRAFLTGSIDSTVKLWSVSQQDFVRSFEEESSILCVKSVYYAPKDPMHLFMTGTLDGVANLWDADMGELIRTFEGHCDWLSSIDMLQAGRTCVTGSADKTAKLWDINTGDCLHTFSDHALRVDCVSCVKDDTFLTGSADKTIKVWDAETGKMLRTFKGHVGQVNDIAKVNAFWFLSASKDNTIKLWDCSTGKCVRTFKDHQDSVNSIAVLNSQQFVTGSSDSTAKLWSMS